MFDPQNEAPIPLADIPMRVGWIPRRRRGRKLHKRTLTRWWIDGVVAPSGTRIRLEVIRVGRTPCTSEDALKRFFAKLAGADALAPTALTRHDRERQIAAAERELAS